MPLSLIDEICRRGAIEMETLLCGILDRSKFAYIPLEYYDVDRAIVKMLPEELTLGRLIVPFDVMSRTVMIAMANPFDAAGKESRPAAARLQHPVAPRVARGDHEGARGNLQDRLRAGLAFLPL